MGLLGGFVCVVGSKRAGYSTGLRCRLIEVFVELGGFWGLVGRLEEVLGVVGVWE